jgi:ubiquinone biosynthesis accessory factor UbiJ
MLTTLLHSAILSSMESCLNQVLSMDTLAQKKLEPLSGKILRVHCELPSLLINIMVSDGRLFLTSSDELTPDTIIRGNATALAKLLAKRKTADFRKDGIVITGNVGLLTALQEILQNIDLDWEYQISKLIGDLPTQALSDSLSAAGKFTRQSRDNLQRDVDDYLHEEKKIFPSAVELKSFYQSVDNLRLRVDRLESRTRRISSLSPT